MPEHIHKISGLYILNWSILLSLFTPDLILFVQTSKRGVVIEQAPDAAAVCSFVNEKLDSEHQEKLQC
jgi:hypothetical protein